MNDQLRETLRTLPDKPGCYLMRDRNARIIYVGKAISLRRRVQNYFRPSTLARAEPKLRSLIHSVAAVEVIVVRNEAEALLTESRLIKEYHPRYNVVFRDDKRYLALRGELHLELPRFSVCRIVRDDGDAYFGPFPSAQVVRTAKDFVEKYYGIRKCKDRSPEEETYRHCLNDVIAHCSAPCIKRISVEEYRARFEEACACLRGERPVVLEQLRTAMNAAAAERDYEQAARLRDAWLALREITSQRARAQPAPGISREDAAAGVNELAELLELPKAPEVIEGFDISHIGGTLTVASMVVSVGGLPARSRYRHFRIRSVEGVDDPRSIAEVVRRRYVRLLEEQRDAPDLVLVDGGITQLRAARAVLQELGLGELPVVGLAERVEEIVQEGKPPLLLPEDSKALQVLMRLRDEAHRFALTHNRALRSRRMRESILDEIDGIGPKRKTALLKHFGSVHRLARATVEDVAGVSGIGKVLAGTILESVRRVLGVQPEVEEGGESEG